MVQLHIIKNVKLTVTRPYIASVTEIAAHRAAHQQNEQKVVPWPQRPCSHRLLPPGAKANDVGSQQWPCLRTSRLPPSFPMVISEVWVKSKKHLIDPGMIQDMSCTMRFPLHCTWWHRPFSEFVFKGSACY